MKKRKALNIYTFIAVWTIIMVIGFIGITLSLKIVQEEYVELQLDINKRNLEFYIGIIDHKIKSGIADELIIQQFQELVERSDPSKGYVCLFDSDEGTMLCHPNRDMLGLKVPTSLTIKDNVLDSVLSWYDVIKTRTETGGVLSKMGQSEITFTRPLDKTRWMISSHENIGAIKSEIARQRKTFLLGFLVFATVMAIVAAYVARKLSSLYEAKIEEKNKLLDASNTQLKQFNEKVAQQHNQIKEQHKSITDSVKYAQKIQEAILTPQTLITDILPDSFIFYKPKNIVSGDFYWLTENDQFKLIAVGDCTGHGVPGAFMSAMAISALSEITGNITKWSAKAILYLLRAKVIKALHQEESDPYGKDGLDIGLCLINKANGDIEYSGAYHDLYILNDEGVHIVKGDKMPIGLHPRLNMEFTNHIVKYSSNNTYYLSSDGIIDQFGGAEGKKLKRKGFVKVISGLNGKAMLEKKHRLGEFFIKWQDNGGQILEQTDDVLVMGFKV